MKREVAIVHFNTPELTEATIYSIRKHGGMDYHVTVFDNSDRKPFTAQMEGVTVIDNTKGQIIDFDKELERFTKQSSAAINAWGSDRHMMSVQKLWDIIPDGFLLLDSDVLIKQSVDFMFQYDQCAVGHVQNPQPGNRYNIPRLVPMVCFINVPLCRQHGLQYFDEDRSWMLHSESMTDRFNWYDTGASFYEDIHAHKNGAHGRRIDIRPLMEHFKKGSWGKKDDEARRWLDKHKELWKPSPQMRGIKDIAICAIGRNENRYAVEWVEHYKKIGVSKLYIYDNWFDGEERLADVLQDYVDDGFVELIPVPNKLAWQCRAYEDCYRKHGDEYAWIGFIDFDEYVRFDTTHAKSNIVDMFKRYDGAECVLLNWRIMTDNGLVHYDDRPLARRFTKAMPLRQCVKYDHPENDHIKCFVRGGLGEIHFGHNPHCPSDKLKSVNSEGKTVNCYCFVRPFTHKFMRIDHYWTKTAEEWMTNKLMRGFSAGHTYISKFVQQQADYFFAVNKRTAEKEAIINAVNLNDQIKRNVNVF